MLRFDDVPAGLIAVLSKLDLYEEVHWQSYEQDDRRKPTDKLTEAVCASSRLIEDRTDLFLPEDPADSEMHYLMIDLDVPAFLVPSTHPGHSHLYVEQPIVWRDLQQLLRALAACGVIETGYASASIDRKSTTLRLPWISKEPEGDDTLISIGQVRSMVGNLANDPDRQGVVPIGEYLTDLYQGLDELCNGRPPQLDDPFAAPQPSDDGEQPLMSLPISTLPPGVPGNEFGWRQVVDANGAYVHVPDQHVYPGEGNWNVIMCIRGDHNLCYAPRSPEPPSMMDPGYRSKWMDVGDKLRAPEKYDVIDERHNCNYPHHPCGLQEWHDWHDYMDLEYDVPRHCEGLRPGGVS